MPEICHAQRGTNILRPDTRHTRRKEALDRQMIDWHRYLGNVVEQEVDDNVVGVCVGARIAARALGAQTQHAVRRHVRRVLQQPISAQNSDARQYLAGTNGVKKDRLFIS